MKDMKLRGPVELLSDSVSFFAKRPAVFILIQIFPVLLALLLAGLGAFFGSAILILFLSGANIGSIPLLVVVILALVFLVIFVFSWSQAALILSLVDTKIKRFWDAYLGSRRFILPIFATYLLSGFLVSGGFLALIIPGVLFVVWFYFASFIVVEEKSIGFGALLRSREYVKGRFWEVLGRIVFWIFFASLIQFVISKTFLYMNLEDVGGIVSAILSIVISPIGLIYSYFIYKDLTEASGEISRSFSLGKKLAYVAVALVGYAIVFCIVYYALSALTEFGRNYPSLPGTNEEFLDPVDPAVLISEIDFKKVL